MILSAIVVAAGLGYFIFGNRDKPGVVPAAPYPVHATAADAKSPRSAEHPLPIHSSTENSPTSPTLDRKRLTSTYVPTTTAATEKSECNPAPAIAQVMSTVSPPPNNGKPASELIAAIENEEGKSAFPNPAIAEHQTVTSERPDANWSQTAAQQLADYFESALGSRFEFPLVQCGHDICELQAASFVAGDSAIDMHDFQQVYHDMREQPWWTALGFNEQTLEVQSSKNGRNLFISFTTRA